MLRCRMARRDGKSLHVPSCRHCLAIGLYVERAMFVVCPHLKLYIETSGYKHRSNLLSKFSNFGNCLDSVSIVRVCVCIDMAHQNLRSPQLEEWKRDVVGAKQIKITWLAHNGRVSQPWEEPSSQQAAADADDAELSDTPPPPPAD
jgi:hypothetical protein